MTAHARAAGPLLLFAGLLAGGCNAAPGGTDVLTGRVTLDGQPVKDLTVVVVGPGPSEASGLTGPDGEYRIVKPPKGRLEFRVTALVPPPPPGVRTPPPGTGGGPVVPSKYAKPGSGLAVDYTGGKQTYDIALTP